MTDSEDSAQHQARRHREILASIMIGGLMVAFAPAFVCAIWVLRSLEVVMWLLALLGLSASVAAWWGVRYMYGSFAQAPRWERVAILVFIAIGLFASGVGTGMAIMLRIFAERIFGQ